MECSNVLYLVKICFKRVNTFFHFCSNPPNRFPNLAVNIRFDDARFYESVRKIDNSGTYNYLVTYDDDLRGNCPFGYH